MKSFDQDPSEVIAYSETVVGDPITSSLWSIAPTGPSVTLYNQNSTATIAMVSNVTSGVKYTLSVLVSCASGQVFDKHCIIRGI